MIVYYVLSPVRTAAKKPYTAVKRERKPKTHPVEKNPLVSFYYPNSKLGGQSTRRDVRLIGANGKYYIGVEVTPGTPAKFKKFLRYKASYMTVQEFNAESVK